MSILEAIVKANYAVSSQQVEELARCVQSGMQGVATYLRVLVSSCQSALRSNVPAGTRKRKVKVDSVVQLASIDTAHSGFYAAVLRGVSDRDSNEKENHRRAVFARTAASTLRSFVRGGGDIITLKADTVTKSGLRLAVAPPEPADKLARRWVRTHDAILRTAKEMAEDNPEFAAEALEAMVAELSDILSELPATAPPVVVNHRLHRTPVREGPRTSQH